MEPKTHHAIHRLTIAVLCLPFAGLAIASALGRLGANPVEQMTHVTGEWALRCLILCLAVTPLRRQFGWSFLAPYRRSLGLLAYAYAVAHFSVYLAFDLAFDLGFLFEDVAERPYITVGFLALLGLTPLAVTSTRAWQRRLGRRWTKLHRLVYPVVALVLLHFAWLVKADLLGPAVHAAVVALLLAARWLPRRS